MRQGQQNRRGRGRNNNNRKGQNPLTRSFESTGPDVKIRGTPSHIAEKYLSLARDASSSGDPVLAENYLQHAEHYNRIIMAFREQQMQQGGGDVANGGMRQRPPASFEPLDGGDEFGEDEGDEFGPEQAPGAEQPQPRYEGQHRFEGRPQRDRHEHHRGHRERYEPRGGEGRGGYGGGGQERQERQDRGPQPQQPADPGSEPGGGRGEGQRRRDRFVRPHEQPEFLRRPVRRPRREEAGPGEGEADTAAPAPATEDTSRE